MSEPDHKGRSPTPALQAGHTPWRMRPRRIVLPTPPMGGKCWLLDDKGLFVLEAGPGVLRTIACTHAGAGGVEAIDGVPGDDGFFPGDTLQPSDPGYDDRNGRPFYATTQAVMGSWMLDAGFYHGLTIRAQGGHGATSAIASIVWLPVRVAAKPTTGL